jgi:hypothetical protein
MFGAHATAFIASPLSSGKASSPTKIHRWCASSNSQICEISDFHGQASNSFLLLLNMCRNIESVFYCMYLTSLFENYLQTYQTESGRS